MKMLLHMFLCTQVNHGQLYSQKEQQQQQGILSPLAEDDEEREGGEEEGGSMGGPKRVEDWPVLEKKKRSKFFHNNTKSMGLRLEKVARRCQGSSCFAAMNSGEVGGAKKFWSGAALSIPADVRECIEGTFDALLSPLEKVRDAEVERIRRGMGDRDGLTGAPQHVSAPSAALAPQHASEVQHNLASSLYPSSFQLQPPLSPPLFSLSQPQPSMGYGGTQGGFGQESFTQMLMGDDLHDLLQTQPDGVALPPSQPLATAPSSALHSRQPPSNQPLPAATTPTAPNPWPQAVQHQARPVQTTTAMQAMNNARSALHAARQGKECSSTRMRTQLPLVVSALLRVVLAYRLLLYVLYAVLHSSRCLLTIAAAAAAAAAAVLVYRMLLLLLLLMVLMQQQQNHQQQL